MAWKRPDKRRVRAIRDRLREMYGQPVNEPHGHPIAELIKTVLSQHTNDRNRDRSFAAPARALPDLGGGPRRAAGGARRRDPPRRPGQAEGAADPGDPRAARRAPRPRLDRTAPREESLEFLLSLPGVGRKTAACVLIFTWGIPEIPVDVHVHRVGGRLGLFPPKASFERAHDEMLAVVDPEDAYELHMNLIRHGRDALPPEAALRRVRAAADVPLVPRDAEPPVISAPPLGRVDPGRRHK